jgi:hypothetical protein
MNIIKFLESLANQGAVESLNAKGSRRDSFTQFGKMGATAAVAAVPFSMLFSQKASAATAAAAAETPVSALQLALTLEYLESEFYSNALDENFLSADERIVIEQISRHETAHVTFLKNTLNTLRATVPAMPNFDFTAGGNFNDVFSNPATFFAVAQAFEDTGVRAYKGQAGNLISEKALLTAALQIHSVEAKHASKIRRMRGLKGWIIGKERGMGMPEATQIVYDGEDNFDQAGFRTNNVTGTFNPPLSATGGTESFDEPMSGATATTIASLFIRS